MGCVGSVSRVGSRRYTVTVMSELALTRPASDEPAVSHTDSLPLTVAWFETAFPPKGEPALGEPETTTWGNFTSIFAGSRREGDKDGCNFVPSRFRLEPDGRQVRRKLDRVIARSAVVLDIETNAKTGEVPPLPAVAGGRLQALGMAAVIYTSHSHHPETNIRYRVILPLEKEVPPEISSTRHRGREPRPGRRPGRSKSTPQLVLPTLVSIRHTRSAPNHRPPRPSFGRQLAYRHRRGQEGRRRPHRRRSPR